MNVFSSMMSGGRLWPLIQAPMAGVSTPALAAAVSNAGALGSIGIGAASLDAARQMIRDTRGLADGKPFNVNVFCHAPAERDAVREAAWLRHLSPLFEEVGAELPVTLNEIYPSFTGSQDLLDMLVQERPAVVSFHFGLPSREAIGALKRAGICLLASVTSLTEAIEVEQAGVDGFVAQGIEAGGHRGVFDVKAADERLSMPVLVRQLVRRSTLPVIAAGGIMDGQGVRAALDLGAVAAQLGTAFILCPESSADGAYRAALSSSDRASSTRLTAALSGRPARGLLNRFIAHAEAEGSPLPAAYPVAYDAAKRLMAKASQRGVHEFAAHWAGQGASLARAMPAAELVATLVAEAGLPRVDG